MNWPKGLVNVFPTKEACDAMCSRPAPKGTVFYSRPTDGGWEVVQDLSEDYRKYFEYS